MINKNDLKKIITLLGEQAKEDIHWAENIKPPKNAKEFAYEIIYVICNSGMKNTIATKIYQKVTAALVRGESATTVFKHKGKSEAIDGIWENRNELFRDFRSKKTTEDQMIFIGTKLPWIGKITQYHVAKNFGVDVAKPDVHLQRLADIEKTTPQKLCERLTEATGYRVATVDTILWRACANGILNSRTGEINA